MMKHIILSLIALLASFLSQAQVLNNMQWLCGSWSYDTKNTHTFEHWEKKSDSLFVGYSFSIIGTDTVSTEKIEIIAHQQKVQYRATVKEQNHGETIPFAMTFCNNDSVVFTNELHDFPQKIVYKKAGDKKMIAVIEGSIQKVWKRREFVYSKQEF